METIGGALRITYTILGGSFKGFPKGVYNVYKGSIVGFYDIRALRITYTMFGAPFCNYSIMGPKTLF